MDWDVRLTGLAAEHAVPGVSLAVLDGDTVTTAATGVLNTATGVPVTPDSLFQIGSISKVYTATALLRLLDRGELTLDARVTDLLPGFRVADPDLTAGLTVMHLLTHSSGIDGDVFEDTGRGDDCLDRYVRACAGLRRLHPLGATWSYCNTGYSVLGRITEVLTGRHWDDALRELLLEPLGVEHTWTLPEDVLRFRAALGHEHGTDGVLRPAARWGLPRSAGPAGGINATATDVLAFARLHLRDGMAADGGRLLAGPTATGMRRPRIAVPNPLGKGDRWGLGWALFDWDDAGVFGHDGSTIGQQATLRVVPAAGVAVVALANSDVAGALLHELTTDVLRELAGVAVPPPLTPPAVPPPADPDRYAGTYERTSVRFEAVRRDDDLVLRVTEDDDLGSGPDRYDVVLTPLGGDRFAGRWPFSPLWQSFRFLRLDDGSEVLHAAGRATPRVG